MEVQEKTEREIKALMHKILTEYYYDLLKIPPTTDNATIDNTSQVLFRLFYYNNHSDDDEIDKDYIKLNTLINTNLAFKSYRVLG